MTRRCKAVFRRCTADGGVLPLYFDEPVTVENYALNGRSTKSFRDQGYWEKGEDAH